MNISPFQSVDQPCDKTLLWAKQQLSQAHLRTIQTFDLYTARNGMHGCSCPHHGTDDCDCQMVILLVYGNMLEPVTLILHGSSDRTWLSISGAPAHVADTTLAAAVQQALETHSPAPRDA